MYHPRPVRTAAKILLVGTFVTAGSTLAHSQTRVDAFPIERERRPPSRALEYLGRGASGTFSVARLNQVFDATSNRIEFSVGPGAAARSRAREESARAELPLVVGIPGEPSAAYRRTFRAMESRRERTDRYDSLIARRARVNDLDPRLIKAIIAAESEFDPGACSPRGAWGLMQVMPRTAEELGFSRSELRDPERNISAGTSYISYLFDTAWRLFHLGTLPYGEAPMWVLQRVISAYHAGPRALLGRRGWARQTRHYVRRVLLFYRSTIADLARRRDAGSDSPPATRSFAGYLF